MGSHYVIGDIHGCGRLLEDLLSQIRREATAEDTVVFLGDYIDRGPDSKGVVDQLLRFRSRFSGKTVFLKGNHELAFLETRRLRSIRQWLEVMDGLPTLRSYSEMLANTFSRRGFGEPEDAFFDRYDQIFGKEHMEFYESLEPLYVSEDVICVHGGLDLRTPLAAQKEEVILWMHPQEMIGRWPGRRMLCLGHKNVQAIRPDAPLEPLVSGNVVCVDTGSALSGVLSAIRLPDRKVYQAKSRLKMRL